MNNKLRVFMAVELPNVVLDELRRAIRHLRGVRISHLRTVRPEGIHLTLKFLGDIEGNQVEPVSEAMTEACREVQSFSLHLGGIGAFPNIRRPRVLWAGVGGHMEPLIELQQSIEAGLEGLGFERGKRGFNPHLTLARMRGGASEGEGQKVVQTLSETHLNERLSIPVDSISLIRSTLTPDGAVYDRMASAPLCG